MEKDMQGVYYFISAAGIILGLAITLATTYLRLYVKTALSDQTKELSNTFMTRELVLEKVGNVQRELNELKASLKQVVTKESD